MGAFRVRQVLLSIQSQKVMSRIITAPRVKGKLRVETSFQTALPSLSGFYARLRDDPPPYVRNLHLLGSQPSDRTAPTDYHSFAAWFC